jgi:hypothetical protein
LTFGKDAKTAFSCQFNRFCTDTLCDGFLCRVVKLRFAMIVLEEQSKAARA